MAGAEAEAAGGATRSPRWRPTLTQLALALILAPIAASAIGLLVGPAFDGYHPSADHAWNELRVRDVGRHETLVGLYSRDGWSHPGPLSFYLMAPFYWITGQSSVGPSLAALAINGASLVGMALIARRRGGDTLMLCVLVGVALMLRTSGAQVVQDPWNLWITTLPYALFVLLCWSLARGERWALPVTVAVGTFLVQTHVGYLVTAGPLLLWGLAGFVWASRRADRVRVAKAAALACGVLLVLWLPPWLDVLRNGTSNGRQIRDWFVTNESPLAFRHTYTEGVRAVSAQFRLWPEWLTTKAQMNEIQETPFAYEPSTPWLLLLAVVPLVWLWRRDGDGRALVVSLAITLVANVVAVARTIGVLYDYRMRPTWVLAMLVCAVALWSMWTTLGPRLRETLQRRLTALALAGLAVVCLINVVTAARIGIPHATDSAATGTLTEQVIARLDTDPDLRDRTGTLVVTEHVFSGSGTVVGVLLQLEKRGYDVKTSNAAAQAVGEHRRVDEDEKVRAVLHVVSGDAVDIFEHMAPMRRIAYWEDPDRRARTRVAVFIGDEPHFERIAVFLDESSV